MAVAFDDLIPTGQSPPAASGAAPAASSPPVAFDDLVPAAPQMSGAGRLPAMIGSSLAKGALEGAGAAGDLQDFLQRQFTQGVYLPIRRAMTGSEGPFAGGNGPSNSPLNSTNLVSLGQSAGVVNRPDLTPQGQGERLISAGAEGAGATLPYLPLAAGSATVNAARGLAQGAASGAGGEEAASMFPNHPVLARVAGSLLGGAAAGKTLNAANRIAGAASGASTPITDAYKNLGIDPTLAGDVTGSPVMQMLQTYAARSPGGANRMHEASGQAIGQWGDALEDTASQLGAARTPQDVGTALK